NENVGNWSPVPPRRGSSASAAAHSAAVPEIGNKYHLKPTRQMKIRPSRERTPALPLVAPVTIIAAKPGIQPITNSNGNGNSNGNQPSVLAIQGIWKSQVRAKIRNRKLAMGW